VLLDRSVERLVRRVIGLRSAGSSHAILIASPDPRPAAAVACLEAGADDYVRLPCDPIELASRITAIRRRMRRPSNDPMELRLDSVHQRAHMGSWEAQFKKTSFGVFAYLSEHAGIWVPADELRSAVLKTNCHKGASNVRWHVLQARRALGPLSWCLHSDQRRGYMFSTNACGGSHCLRVRAGDGENAGFGSPVAQK
jgi:DNA-binding response OmpR family regulator